MSAAFLNCFFPFQARLGVEGYDLRVNDIIYVGVHSLWAMIIV